MMLWSVENILYNRQIMARGVILGRRTYRSELARTQKPCQLLEHGLKISFQTPHKRDLVVFVPESELTEGKVLTWLRYDDATRKTLESEIRLVDVSGHHVTVETLSEQERTFPKRGRGKRIGPITSASFGLANNPFLRHQPPEPRNIAPDRIVWDSLTFVKRSNFCFVWDPERRKRAGTSFRQVYPEEIQAETFRWNSEPYDILTGRKLDTFQDGVRNLHFRTERKPSPTYTMV